LHQTTKLEDKEKQCRHTLNIFLNARWSANMPPVKMAHVIGQGANGGIVLSTTGLVNSIVVGAISNFLGTILIKIQDTGNEPH
jgi:hypothetical protein